MNGQLSNVDIVNLWLENENVTEAKKQAVSAAPDNEPEGSEVNPKDIVDFSKAKGLAYLFTDRDYIQLEKALQRLSDEYDREFNRIYRCFKELYFQDFQKSMGAFAKRKSFIELENNLKEYTREGFEDGFMAFYFKLVKSTDSVFFSNEVLFKIYFLRFCRNNCLKIAQKNLRDKKKQRDYNDSMINTEDKVETTDEIIATELLFTEQEKLLAEACGQLDKRTRVLVKMRVLDNLKPGMIAKKVAMPADKIARKIHDALNKMWQYVQKNKNR